MAWYFIVLIVIGAHLALLLMAIILLACNVDEDKVTMLFFPILYFMEKNQVAKSDAKWNAERRKEEENLTKYHYPKLHAIRVSKKLLDRITVNNVPPDYIPLGHEPYQSPDGYAVSIHTPVQVIYYEGNYSVKINDYILRHYDEICNKLKEENITFVYIPKLLNNLQDAIAYLHPDAWGLALNTYSAEDFYREFSDGIAKKPSDDPMLIVPDFFKNAGYSTEELDGGNVGCHAFLLNYIEEEQFDFVFQKHLDEIIRMNIVRYSLAKSDKEEDYADYASINDIAKEIQARINQLYAMGVSEYAIRQIVSLPEPKLSPLTITDDFRIILPDYNNMEITMPTLSKVLFFFYLRHHEGVLFKHLRDHKDELFELYRTISPFEDMEKMERSIEDIIDSTKNSVNEKCSRIKAAFVSQFNDKLAKEYYITGAAGEPKRITLDRKLVEDMSGIIIQ